MGRRIMGGDFRAISKVVPVVAEPQPDPRLALVDLFKGTQVFRPEGHDPDAPLPEGALDFSGDEVRRVGFEDAQEPAERPETGSVTAAPVEEPTVADEAPADAEQDEKDEAPKQPEDEQDYDPIAAVLG